MWMLITFGIVPGLLLVFLYKTRALALAIRISSALVLLLTAYYFLGKLAMGPPLFSWQPPFMIPNQVFYLTPLLGMMIGFLLIWKPVGTGSKTNPKYRNSTVTSNELDNLQHKLIHLIDSDQVYLQKDISLEELAHLLYSDRHTVSRLINERFGKNFFNFINGYRIQHFINLVTQESSPQGFAKLAEQVGFRSKTSFFKAFKRETQQTPTQFFKDPQPQNSKGL